MAVPGFVHQRVRIGHNPRLVGAAVCSGDRAVIAGLSLEIFTVLVRHTVGLGDWLRLGWWRLVVVFDDLARFEACQIERRQHQRADADEPDEKGYEYGPREILACRVETSEYPREGYQ